LTDQIKNRLVGTIVIFSLAIIFLPDILDGKKQQSEHQFVTIPVKPQPTTPVIVNAPENDNEPAIVAEPEKVVTAPLAKPVAALTAPVTAKPVSSPEPKKPTAVAAKKPAAKTSSTVQTTPAPKKSNATWRKKPTAQKTVSAWVIAVGSFKEPGNVKSLLLKLRKKGFTAFSVPAKPRQGENSKVFVGPSSNKANLVKLQSKLKAAINESGYITTYNPTKK
jgi:DedD protein